LNFHLAATHALHEEDPLLGKLFLRGHLLLIELHHGVGDDPAQLLEVIEKHLVRQLLHLLFIVALVCLLWLIIGQFPFLKVSFFEALDSARVLITPKNELVNQPLVNLRKVFLQALAHRKLVLILHEHLLGGLLVQVPRDGLRRVDVLVHLHLNCVGLDLLNTIYTRRLLSIELLHLGSGSVVRMLNIVDKASERLFQINTRLVKARLNLRLIQVIFQILTQQQRVCFHYLRNDIRSWILVAETPTRQRRRTRLLCHVHVRRINLALAVETTPPVHLRLRIVGSRWSSLLVADVLNWRLLRVLIDIWSSRQLADRALHRRFKLFLWDLAPIFWLLHINQTNRRHNFLCSCNCSRHEGRHEAPLAFLHHFLLDCCDFFSVLGFSFALGVVA